MPPLNLAITLVFTTILLGCVSTSDVLEMGRDTYSVTSTADGFRAASAARESAFQMGTKKCASLGKRFMFMNERSGHTRMGVDTTTSVTFRCLSEDDPEYRRPLIERTPDVLIQDRRY